MTTAPDPLRLELRGLRLAGHEPIDLRVRDGDLVAVSGWGSSDLLWAVAGLGRAEAGTIAVDGRPIAGRAAALDAGVALIPQGGALVSLLTAYENVLLPLLSRPALAGPDPAGRNSSGTDSSGRGGAVERARDALDRVGLAESADHLVEELSGGQQQRVAIARALAGQPRLLLADQVTTDLDPGNRVRMLGLLRDLAAHGSAVLVASDDPAVTDACDRTVTI